jgi:hypothetical protein
VEFLIFDIYGFTTFDQRITELVQICDAFFLVYSLTKLGSFNIMKEIKKNICDIKNFKHDRKAPVIIVGKFRRK